MKQEVKTDGAVKATGLLSQAVVSNGFIFLSGFIHNTPEGKLIEGSVEDRVRQIMKNLEAVLQAAGADFSHVVKATVYVTDIAELPQVNEIYKTYFSDPFPAREGICVKALPLGATIEISMVAAKS